MLFKCKMDHSNPHMLTPHLNGKKLSTNSSWDFEHVFETMDDYWVGPDENFFPESTPTRWRCDHFSKKWSKSKSDTTLSIKKPFVTPNFCGWNFSAMHHFWVWNFFCLQELPNNWYEKQKMLQNDIFFKIWSRIKRRVIHRLVLGSFWHQKWCIAEKFQPKKLGVTKGFFILKVVSDFVFDHFLEQLLQRHLVGVLSEQKFSSGPTQ